MGRFDVPWILGSDFNIIRDVEEKIGVVFNYSAMQDFDDFVEDLGLIDLPLVGDKFTWGNNRERPSFSRLDRFLVTSKFLVQFSEFTQKVLPRSLSDHNPLILFDDICDWGPKPFRLFNYWLDIKEFKDIVRGAWIKGEEQEGGDWEVWHRLRKLKPPIKSWFKKSAYGKADKIQKIEEEIQELEMQWRENAEDEEVRKEIKKLKGELWELYRAEELEWQQKSRMKWMQEGDRNTKFFHMVASARRRNNVIRSLDFHNNVVEEPNKLKEKISKHFEEHYNMIRHLKLRIWKGISTYFLQTVLNGYKGHSLKPKSLRSWKVVMGTKHQGQMDLI